MVAAGAIRILLLAALLLASGCAHEDKWTKRDTAMQVGLAVLVAYDAHLTAHLKETDGFTEGGNLSRRVLGRTPEASDTYMYLGSAAVFYFLVSRALPAKWRPYWQAFNMLQHAHRVTRHCLDGLCK